MQNRKIVIGVLSSIFLKFHSKRKNLLYLLAVFCVFAITSLTVNAQILPPSYNPLPPETLKSYKNQAEDIKQQIESKKSNKKVLEYNISHLKETNLSDSSIAENLKNESKNYQKEMFRLISLNAMDSALIREVNGKINQFIADSLTYSAKIDSVQNIIIQLNLTRGTLSSAVKKDSLTFRKLLDSLVNVKDRFDLIDELYFRAKNSDQDSSQHRFNELSCDGKISIIDSLVNKEVNNLQSVIKKDYSVINRNENIIKYLRSNIDSLSKTINLKSIEIEKLKRNYEQNVTWSQQIFLGSKQRDSVIINLESELVKIKSSIDSLQTEYKDKSEIARGYTNIATRVFLPITCKDDAVKFYGDPELLDRVTFNIESKSLSIEGITNYIGPFRYGGSISTKLSPSGDNSASSNLTDFYSNGGDLVLYTEYPLLYKVNNSLSFTVQTLAKAGISNIFGRPKYNIDPGLEVYGKVKISSFISFFAFYRQGLAIGFNDFYKKVGYAKDVPFTYGQLVAGIQLWKFKFSLSGVPVGNKNLTRPIKFTSLVIQSPFPR